jgi:hypothetical protein
LTRDSHHLPTLADAALGCLLAILVAFHRIRVRIADFDALLFGLLAGVDAGISVFTLCPGYSACDYHQA